MAQTTIVTAPVGSPVRPRGVLAVASPAPDGWEEGGIQFTVACPSPLVEDKCLYIGTVEGVRPSVATFPAFLIEQLVECSTLSGEGRDVEARDALVASTDYALGLTLANGAANTAVSFADATSHGNFTNIIDAVAALEAAAVAAGKGSEWVLHASVDTASFLTSEGLIDSTGRSPGGASWIISAGYPTAVAGVHTLWATGKVVASAGPVDVNTQIDHRVNNREALASRSVIVGFNPCILESVTFTNSEGE